MTSVGGLLPVGWGSSAAERVGAGAGTAAPVETGASAAERTGKPLPASFGQLLGRAVEDLGAAEERADLLTARLARGEPVELHEVIIATEKAQLAFDLAVQLRNRVVEAYQEIMRMPV